MLLTFGRCKSQKFAVDFRLSVEIRQSNRNMATFGFAITNKFTYSCSTLITLAVNRNLTVNLSHRNAFFFFFILQIFSPIH